jgi:tetratricopeptide (TPR) repeat protein
VSTFIFFSLSADNHNMHRLRFLMLFLLFGISLWGIAPESVALNNQAMKYYEARNWSAAIAAFEKAIAVDPRNFLAHFNLACSLAMAKKADPQASTWSRIGLHLKKSLTLNHRRLGRIRVDPDLDEFRRTFFYQSAFGSGLLAGNNLKSFLGGNRFRATLERGESTIHGTAVFSLEGGLVLDFPDIGMRFSGMWSTVHGELRWQTPGRPMMYAYYSGLGLVFPLTPWGVLHITDFQ